MRRGIVTMGVAVLAGTLLAGGPAALAQTTDRGQEQPPQNQPMERSEGQTTEPTQGRPIELPQVEPPQAELMERGQAAVSRPDDVPPSDQPTAGVPVLDEKVVDGTVKQVIGNRLTLSDGTQLTVPSSTRIPKRELRPGASIKAGYEEREGQRILKSIELAPTPGSVDRPNGKTSPAEPKQP